MYNSVLFICILIITTVYVQVVGGRSFKMEPGSQTMFKKIHNKFFFQ